MKIGEALEIAGFSLCEFKSDGEDECSTCEKPIEKGGNIYYERTCYEYDEGEYHCESCVIAKPKEWDELAAYYEKLDK